MLLFKRLDGCRRQYSLCLVSVLTMFVIFGLNLSNISMLFNNEITKAIQTDGQTDRTHGMKEDDITSQQFPNRSDKNLQRIRLKYAGYISNASGSSVDIKREGNASHIYNENTLFEAIQNYHDSFYTAPKGEKCTQRFPKCIIIGVMKCGTRELIDFLAAHPHIVIKKKPLYELNHFIKMEHTLDWYKRQMPCSYSDQITVTKSPLYFTDEHAPENLRNFNKSLKMILLVREPIKRALSEISFHFFFKYSRQVVRDLSKMPPVDDRFVDNTTGHVRTNERSIKLSTYDVAMKRYLKYFTRDQFLVIETEDFKKNPAKVLYKVESFLGLDHVITKDMFVYDPDKGHYCIRTLSGEAACYGTDRGRTKQKPLRIETLKKLKVYFNKHNKAFFDLIGERFKW